MRVRCLGPAFCALLLFPAAASGQQATVSRLSVGIAGGVITGGELWAVPRQPLEDVSTVDTLRLTRRIRSGFSLVAHATWFPATHWGITVEGQLLGLGTADACSLAYSSGNQRGTTVCSSLNSEASGHAAALGAGVEYRPWVRRTLQPYLRGHVALAFSQHSTLRLTGQDVGSGGEPVVVRIYQDGTGYKASPVVGIGLGLTAAISPAYQLRWEARDQITSLPVVTGPTPVEGLVPPSGRRWEHLFSVTFGIDVVLDRKRGRRY